MNLDTISLKDILNFASDAGVIGLLVFVLVGGAKKWWVWGWSYEELVKDRDEWKELALSGTNLAERAVDLAAKKPRRPRATTRVVAVEKEE